MERSERRQLICCIVAAAVFTCYVVTFFTLRRELKTAYDKVVDLQVSSLEWRTKALQWEEAYNQLTYDVRAEREALANLLAAEDASSQAADQEAWIDAGEFRITHYCPCKKCCGKWAGGITASGATAQEGRTVAVDPKVIPLGSEVQINGKLYVAEDTGVGGKAIDVFLNDHQRCLEAGMYYTTVKWRPADT